MDKKKTALRLFVYASWLLLIYVTIADLFDQPYRSIIWIGSLIIMLLIHSSKIPSYLEALFSLVVVLNVFGETIFGIYYNFISYDKILHFFVPVVLCILIAHFVKDKIKDKKLLVMFCICAVITLCVGWEIVEYSFDRNFDSLMQGVHLNPDSHFFGMYERREVINELDDTLGDLMFDLMGSSCFGIIYLLRNNKLKKNI